MMAYFRDRDMAQGMDLDQQDDEDEDIEDDEEEIDVSDEEREAFNMEVYYCTFISIPSFQATTSHQYLHAEDEIDCKLGEYWIEGSESVQVPVLRQDIVCLPGIPFSILRQILQDKLYLFTQLLPLIVKQYEWHWITRPILLFKHVFNRMDMVSSSM